MKHFGKYCRSIICLLFSLVFLLSFTISSYADVSDLMIGTGSNALMTLELDGDDYNIMPMSSMGTVANTIESSKLSGYAYITDANNANGKYIPFDCVIRNGRYDFQYSAPDGYFVRRFIFRLYRSDLPNSGSYAFSFDVSSHISFDYETFYLFWNKLYENASPTSGRVFPSCIWDSGDLYVAPYALDISNVYYLDLYCYVAPDENIPVIGGSFAINFTLVDSGDYPTIGGLDTSSQDYQNDVSSSLSDLSSSVDSMTDEIGGVTEAIQNLQGAMEPHYNNVLTQLHHITEQLHAFYDQVYNNIHLAQMNLLGQIKEAIENIDLEVNISLDGLKQTIQQVGQNVITNDNKISSDQIANDEANIEEVKDAVKEHGNFIIDGLKGLFIPSDEFFKSYFDDLYAYFSDRFGFLSFPIDLLIRTVNLFINSSDVDAVLTLPSFEISGEQVWADQSFNFTEFMETNFAFLLAAIRTVTSIGMIYAFVNLCQDKWDEVMKN